MNFTISAQTYLPFSVFFLKLSLQRFPTGTHCTFMSPTEIIPFCFAPRPSGVKQNGGPDPQGLRLFWVGHAALYFTRSRFTSSSCGVTYKVW